MQVNGYVDLRFASNYRGMLYGYARCCPVALLGLLFIPLTIRAGLYRAKSGIFLGDGGDLELQRRVRGQGNFIETVPIALILLVVMELSGAGSNCRRSGDAGNDEKPGQLKFQA